MLHNLEDIQAQWDTHEVIPLIERLPADTLTPVSAFLRLRKTRTPAFLFESCGHDLEQARYSFMGIDPVDIVMLKEGRVQHSQGEIDGPPLKAFQSQLKTYTSPPHADLPPFLGGYVGYLGYDCIQYIEPVDMVNMPPQSPPEACAMQFKYLVIFDHLKQHILLVANLFTQNTQAADSYEEAKQQLNTFKTQLAHPVPEERHIQFVEQSLTQKPVGRTGESAFCEQVKRVQEAIYEGETFQTVLSEQFELESQADSFLVYRVLRSLSPSPYLFYMDIEGLTLLGASPEMLLKSQNRTITTSPIAGTRPRGKSRAEDEAYEQEMVSCNKEKAEHVMLVDLGRNDIGRVARAGSVKVTQYMEVERFSHVMHLVSKVQGELKDNLTPFDALLSVFPAGTLSGAPKVRAMQLISELEQRRRGWYGGAVFYQSYQGNLDACITIRTLSMHQGKAVIQVGAGIVADSVPKHEYKEIHNKARALFLALETAEQLKEISP